MLCIGCLTPRYDPKWSRICTIFGSGFTEEGFDQIHKGMISDSVKLLIGPPIEIVQHFYPERKHADGSVSLWYYSKEGPCSSYNYAWLGREVFFDENGKVTVFCRSICRDD